MFLYDSTNGVMQVDPSTGKATSIPGLGQIANITSIATFETQNLLYMLDSSDGIVFRSIPLSDNSYSLAANYISDDTIKSAVNLSVDGNVFILTKDGVIERYFGGQSTPFSIGNTFLLGSSVGHITNFFDSEYTNNIYLLDPANERVIVIAKPTNNTSIAYNVVKQYVYRGDKKLFNNLTSIFVDHSESYMYLVSGTKVIKVQL